MNRTILIVDDSKTERVILDGYLKADYSIIEAASGEEAIELLSVNWRSISTIVLDIVMPGMDGFETLKKIKADAQWQPIPVVITTGLDDENSRERAVALGADSFVTKPFSQKLLLHTVDNAVQLREMADKANEIIRDKLTGLLNRDSFFLEVERMIRRHESGHYTLSCIDIESFKVINDQYGTEIGDEVLKHVAQSLNSFVSSIGGLCARYMADIFAILYPSSHRNSPEIAKNHIAVTAPNCLRQPIRICVGRYSVDDTSLPASVMFDRAVMAGESVKGRYDTYIGEYSEKMRNDLLREQQIVGDMVSALEGGEFVPWFQPQYNHATGALIGAEALVRWQKDGKFIFPSDFIPVFEKNGFIYEIDQFIWRQVCVLLRRWLDEGKEPLPVSVNISRYDMFQKNFVSVLTGLLEEYKLPAELLRLEITESAFSAATNVITDIAGRLIDAGFTVEIDDFGSGYSSLNTLKDVPASILKLDMRFFENSHNSDRGGNIVESVVRMAMGLGMAVIAEGVEDKAQADYLKTIGCYYIQGYYYAKPMPTNSYEAEMEKAKKEQNLSRLETMETLDSNLFWDPKSMETLIFNSYVGGACIFEYCKGKIELLRINDRYVKELHGLIPLDAKLSEASIVSFLDEAEMLKALALIEKAIAERSEAAIELRLQKGEQVEYIRMMGRIIARADDRVLCYGVIHNLTEQYEAEQRSLISAERISAIMDNTKCGITAFVISPEGDAQPLFINNRFYELLGYTPEQYHWEVKGSFDCIYEEDREAVVNASVKLQHVGESAAMTMRAVRRDGSIIWLRADIAIVKFANVAHPVQLSNFLDITEQIKIEQKRDEAARQLQVIMGNVNGSVSAYVMDDAGNTTPIFCNEKYYQIFGYTKEQAEAIQLDVLSCIVPEDFVEVLGKLKKLKKDGIPIDIDYRAQKRDGSIIFVRCIASRISMEGYGDEVIVAVETDFTEQHTLQDQLRAIIENINGGVSVVQIHGGMPKFLLVNEMYFEIIGYTREQFHAEITNVFDLIHPDDRDRVEKVFMVTETRQKQHTIEYRIIRRNGAIRHVLCNTTIMRLFGVEEPVQLSVVNDVTILREVQHKERDISVQLKAIMDNIHGGITASVFHNEDDVEFIFTNDGFYELFGYTEEQFKAELPNTLDLIIPEDRGKTLETIMRIVREHGCETYEYRCRKRDGSLMWAQVTNAAITLEGVSDTVLLAIITDVTQLRRTELENKATTDRLRTVMNTMINGVTAVAIRGDRAELLFANNRYYQMHGIDEKDYDKDRLTSIFSRIYPEDRQRIRELVLSLTEVGQTAQAEFRLQQSDGSVRWKKAVFNVTRLIDVDVPVQVTIYTDITEEKAATDQLRFLNESAGEILSQPDSEMAIHNSLSKLLTYFQGERAYIFELDDAKMTSDNTYEICAPGVEPEIEWLKGVPYDTQQYWFDAFRNDGFIAISNVKAITGESEVAMRDLLLVQNISSIIVAPLWRDGELIGYMGVDNPTKAVEQVSRLIALSDYIAVLLTRRDLTQALERGRLSMQQLMDDTPGGFLRMRIYDDKTPTIVSFNTGFSQMIGMTDDEVMAAYGDDAYKYLNTEDVAAAAADAAEAFNAYGKYSMKCRLKKKNGDYVWTQAFGRFIEGENSERFLNAYFTDITEEKSAEQLEIELLDNMPTGAALYEYDGRSLKVIHINKRYWELVGRKPTDYDKTSPFGAIHQDDRALVAQEIESAIRNHRDIAVDCRLLYGDGSYRPFHITAKAEAENGGGYLLYTSYAPISNEAMSIQEMLPIALSTMVSSSDDMSYVKDKGLRFICVSKSVVELAGYKNPRDFIGKTAEEVFAKSLADKFNSDDLHVIQTGEAIMNIMEHIPTPNGRTSLVRTSKFPILDATGSAVGIYSVSRDITAQREKESQLELISSSIPGGLAAYALTKEGFNTLYFNDGFYAYSGYTREEFNNAIEREPLALVFEDDKPKILELARDFIEKKQDGMTGSCTYRCKTKNGGSRWLSAKAVLSQVGEDAFILNVIKIDVTETREAYAQLKLLTDSIPGGLATFCCKPQTVETIYFSDGICELVGYSREEYEKNPIPMLELVQDEDIAVIREQKKLLIAGETNLNFNVRIHAKDKMKWINNVAHVTDRVGDAFYVSAVLTDVTEQQEERERIRLANEEYRIAVLQSNCTICRYNIEAQTMIISLETAKQLELPEVISGVPYERVKQGRIGEETKDAYIAFFESIMRGEKENNVVYRKLLPVGWRWIEAHATTVFDAENKPFSAIISCFDVTEQRERDAIYNRWQNSIAERPKDSYTLLRCNLSKNVALDSMDGELLPIDIDQNIGSLDARMQAFIVKRVYADDRERLRAFLNVDTMLAEYYRGHRADSIEFRGHINNGETRWLKLSVDLVEYPDSSDVQAYLMFENIDDSKRAQQIIIQRAETDSLTGALNHATFAIRADKIISESKPGAKHALLMLDIDGFKLVNDMFGHGAGDRTLIELSKTLTTCSRKEDLVGRLGGDEFVLFLNNIPSEALVARKAQQLTELARKDLGMGVRVSISIGIAMFPTDGENFETLYKAADSALYRVKDSGKNGYAFTHESKETDTELKLQPAVSAKATIEPSSLRRILIVDDNKVDMEILARIFRSDFRVEKATDGAMALMKLRHYGTAISVVLLDLHMPDIDGYEVLKNMRQNESACMVPVIVVTADEQRETALKVIRAGADDLIVKPVVADMLRVRVESAISRAENERTRVQNSYLAMRNKELSSYKSALERSGIMVIALEWGKNEFSYSQSVSARLSGEYDGKHFWRVLLSNMVTDAQTVRKMQQLVHDVAEDRNRSEGDMTVKLKTISGITNLFDMRVFKEVNDFGIAARILITLKEADIV